MTLKEIRQLRAALRGFAADMRAVCEAAEHQARNLQLLDELLSRIESKKLRRAKTRQVQGN